MTIDTKKILRDVILIILAVIMTGWGTAPADTRPGESEKMADHDKAGTPDPSPDQTRGQQEAGQDRQGNDENIKRAQGDEKGLRDIHQQGALQDDDRGRF